MYRKHFGLARHPFAKDLAVEDVTAEHVQAALPETT